MSKKVEFSTRLTREDVAGIVEAVVEGLKEGLLKVQKSNETLELSVPRVIDLEVKGFAGEDREVFNLEVSWRPNREENPDIDDNKTSKEELPKHSMREAADAAEEAAKQAGYAVKKTAGVASALFRENSKKLLAEVEEFKSKNPGNFFSRAAEALENAARKAGELVKDAVRETNNKSYPKEKAAPTEQSTNLQEPVTLDVTATPAPQKTTPDKAAAKSSSPQQVTKKATESAKKPVAKATSKPTASSAGTSAKKAAAKTTSKATTGTGTSAKKVATPARTVTVTKGNKTPASKPTAKATTAKTPVAKTSTVKTPTTSKAEPTSAVEVTEKNTDS